MSTCTSPDACQLELCIGQEFVKHQHTTGPNFSSHDVTLYQIVDRSDTHYFFRERNAKVVESSGVHGCGYQAIIFDVGFASSDILFCLKKEWHAQNSTVYQLHVEKQHGVGPRFISNSGILWGTDYPGTAYAITYDCWPSDQDKDE